ncbi:MAG: AraC family transcriptional regulator [Bacteroidales bacterium]|nr:AraC family transcriptional regulator [Bacteroidales bacterium]
MDISVYDNYSGAVRDFNFFQIDGEYKMCDSLLLILCMRGRARFRIRLLDVVICRGYYLAIGANDPFFIVDSSEDFHIDVVRIGSSAFALSYDEVLKNRLERLLINRPASKISEKKTMMFHIIHSYVKVMIKERHDFYRDLILLEYVKIFLYEACHILDDTYSESNISQKERNITGDFFIMVEKRFKEDRKVDNYAKDLGITAKHLAYVIKKTTGKHPSEWLESYVLLEAKKLLKSTDDSIQNIAFDLNFATPSHFSKFFKDRTDMTPKEFRAQGIEIHS